MTSLSQNVDMVQIRLKQRLWLLPLLLICSFSPVIAWASRTHGTRTKVTSEKTFTGDSFVVTTDSAGDAVRICAASFNVLSCFDPRTWKRLWSERTPYGSIDTNPVISGDIVLYSGGGGAWTIYGRSAQSGQIFWLKNHQSYSLAVGRGMLFADGYGTGVIALAPRTGKEIWSFGGIGPGMGIGSIWFYEGKLFTDSYILDAQTGKLVKLLHSGPRVFAASHGTAFGANFHGTLRAWNAASGAAIWSRTLHSVRIGVGLAANSSEVFSAFYKKSPYFGHHGVIEAYNASDGRVLWDRKITSDIQTLGYSPIVADSSHVYLIEPSNTAHGSQIIALDGRTGRLKWSCPTVKTAYGPPVQTREFVFVEVGRATLVMIRKRNGKIVRSLPFP